MDRLHGVLVFLRVVEHGTLSGAARALGVSTAAVSSTLSRLEKQLSVRLLNRTTRRLSTTVEGAEFYERCKRITSDLAQAEIMVGRHASKAPSGWLRVRLPFVLGHMWIVPRLPQFMRDYPSLSVEVVCMDFVPHTIEDGIDLSVQTGKLHDSALAVRRLASASYAVCGAPSYFSERGAPASPDDLIDHTCIAYRRPRDGRVREWKFRDGANTKQVPINSPMIFNRIELLIEAAKAGYGLVQLPECYTQPYIERGEFVETLTEHRASGFEICVVYRQPQRDVPKLRVFMNFLETIFDPPPWNPVRAGRSR